MSILISGADQRALVFRSGIEIGRSRLTIDDRGEPLGTHVFIVMNGDVTIAGAGSSGLRWIAVGVLGHAGATKGHSILTWPHAFIYRRRFATRCTRACIPVRQ